MWTVLGVVALLVLTAALTSICERQRRSIKISRFLQREMVPVNRLVDTIAIRTSLSVSSLVQSWKTAASILGIDPSLLRATDRFDHELAPVKGFPVEDELVELGELLDEAIDEAGMTNNYPDGSLKLETLGEYVEFLARLRNTQQITLIAGQEQTLHPRRLGCLLKKLRRIASRCWVDASVESGEADSAEIVSGTGKCPQRTGN